MKRLVLSRGEGNTKEFSFRGKRSSLKERWKGDLWWFSNCDKLPNSVIRIITAIWKEGKKGMERVGESWWLTWSPFTVMAVNPGSKSSESGLTSTGDCLLPLLQWLHFGLSSPQNSTPDYGQRWAEEEEEEEVGDQREEMFKREENKPLSQGEKR